MKYEIKEAEHVIVITLYDKSFETFTDAIIEVTTRKRENKKVLMMQSIEKENEPFRVVIVFEF